MINDVDDDDREHLLLGRRGVLRAELLGDDAVEVRAHRALLDTHSSSLLFLAVRAVNALGCTIAVFLLLSLGAGAVLSTFFTLFDESSDAVSTVSTICLLTAACIAVVSVVPFSVQLLLGILWGKELFDIRRRCFPGSRVSGVAVDISYLLVSTLGSLGAAAAITYATGDGWETVIQWFVICNALLHVALSLLLMVLDSAAVVFFRESSRIASYTHEVEVRHVMTVPRAYSKRPYTGLHSVSASLRKWGMFLGSVLFLGLSIITVAWVPQFAPATFAMQALFQLWIVVRTGVLALPGGSDDSCFGKKLAGPHFALMHSMATAGFALILAATLRTHFSKTFISVASVALALSALSTSLWVFCVFVYWRRGDAEKCCRVYSAVTFAFAKVSFLILLVLSALMAFFWAKRRSSDAGVVVMLSILGVLLLLFPVVDISRMIVRTCKDRRFRWGVFRTRPKSKSKANRFVPVLVERLGVVAMVGCFIAILLLGCTVVLFVKLPTGRSESVAAANASRPFPRTGGGLPVCDSKFTKLGLTVVDLAFFSELSYENGTAVESDLLTWFGPEWRLRSTPAGNSSHFVLFYDFVHLPTNTSVIAIRGTSNFLDVLRDTEMWIQSLLVRAMQIFVPGYQLIPFSLSRLFVYISSCGWAGLDLSRSFVPILAHMNNTVARERIVVGHSLGGGIAQVVSRLTDVRSVSFSPPGSLYSSARFGAEDTKTTERLSQTCVSVIPDSDIVTQVDMQRGMMQTIPCDGGHLARCHMLTHTNCYLIQVCGDERGRSYTRAKGLGNCDERLL